MEKPDVLNLVAHEMIHVCVKSAETDLYSEGMADYLSALLPYQRADFEEILEAMDGLPVTIRLLDPPLHEFLPGFTELSMKVAVAEAAGKPNKRDVRMLRAVKRMHEENPMLGLRGVRLGVVIPGLFAMQIKMLPAQFLQQREGRFFDDAILGRDNAGQPPRHVRQPLPARVPPRQRKAGRRSSGEAGGRGRLRGGGSPPARSRKALPSVRPYPQIVWKCQMVL